MFYRKLAISNFTTRKIRTALTVAAIAVSVALVVAVTSGYASVQATVLQFLNQHMGSADAQIAHQYDSKAGIDETLVEELRRDPEVNRVTGRLEIESALIDSNGKVVPGRAAQIIGVRRPQDTRIENLRFEGGSFFNSSDGDVAVIDQVTARNLKEPGNLKEDAPHLNVGDTFSLPGINGPLKLTIIGIIHKPEVFALARVQTIYLPIETLQKFSQPGMLPQVTQIQVDLKPDANVEVFRDRWTAKLAAAHPGWLLKLTREKRKDVLQSFESMRYLSYMGGAVSMVAATFIVFSSLSMGVAERQRTLAMLRAVGAYRSQIAILVIAEGILLALAGVGIGVPLGWTLIYALSKRYHDLFTAGVVLSWGGMIQGGVGSMVAAILASALPAWSAARVSPLEAMTPLSKSGGGRIPIVSSIVGLIFIGIDPFFMFSPFRVWLHALGVASADDLERPIRFYGHFFLGVPSLMIGFFLLAPLFVWVVERVLGPIVAWIMGVRYVLLRQQLTGGIWRSAGTCAALMVGLAILVVMQTQGNSMIAGWRLPTHFPDIFIFAGKASGLDAREQAILMKVEGLRTRRVNGVPVLDAQGREQKEIMPLPFAAPGLGSGVMGMIGAAFMPDATMFFGVDPDLVFQMMELDFREGNAPDAQRMLGGGRQITLVDGSVVHASIQSPIRIQTAEGQKSFPSREVHLIDRKTHIVELADGTKIAGDVQGTLLLVPLQPDTPLETPESSDEPAPTIAVPHEIAADQVARIEKGRYLIVTEEFRTLKGLGLGDPLPLQTITEGLQDFIIVGVVWSPGIDVMVSSVDAGRQFDQRTAASVFGTLDDARQYFGATGAHMFAANLEMGVAREKVMENVQQALGGMGMFGYDTRMIKYMIEYGVRRILALVSTIAFAAMGVAALGVSNTIMASVRSQRWRFGILRSIGVTRSQLLRLVLAEAILLGAIGCALGLVAGFEMTLDARQLGKTILGILPPLAVPWGIILTGTGIVMAISILASLWPAIHVARSEPLTLLQAGRAST